MKTFRLAVFFAAGAAIFAACGGAMFLQSNLALPPALPSANYPIAQGFSQNIASPAATLDGNRSFIWSTGNGSGCCQISPVAGISSGGYWPLFTQNTNFNINGVNTGSQYNMLWFLSNHPDWVAYKCDQQTPAWRAPGYATTVVNGSPNIVVTAANYNPVRFAVGNIVGGSGLPINGSAIASYAGSGPNITLSSPWTGASGTATLYYNVPPGPSYNFALPAVRAWVRNYLAQYAAAGFGGLNFDNGTIANVGQYCGWWEGAQTGTDLVASAANNGSGLIRLTLQTPLGAGAFQTNSALTVSAVGGTTEANGSWLGTLIDSTHIDLQGSAFVNAYTSGGSIIFSRGTSPSFGGSWVQPYLGTFNAFAIDVNYAEAAINWACSLTQWAHQQSPQVYTIGNVFDVGFAFDNGSTNEPAFSYEQRMAGCFDMQASESMPLQCKLSTVSFGGLMCTFLSDSAFDRYFTTQQQISQQRGWWLVEYTPCRTDAVAGPYSCVSLARKPYQVYFTAVWLLLRGMPTDPTSYWSPIGFLNRGTGTEHAAYSALDATWTPAVGQPTARPYFDSGGCYLRYFATGVVALNRSSTLPCSFTIPPSSSDQFGTPVGAGIDVLQPLTAAVLVTPTP